MRYLFLIAPIVLAACQTTTTSAPARVMYPVERCGYIDQPVYGVLDRPASQGEVLGGAAIGGVIGNSLTDNAGGAIIGALIGGGLANQRRQERVIVDYEKVYRCQTVYE